MTVKMTSVYKLYGAPDHGDKMASFISGLKKSKKHQLPKDVTGKVTVIEKESRQLQHSRARLDPIVP